MKASLIKSYLTAATALTLGVPGLASAGDGGSFVGWHGPRGQGSHSTHWNYSGGKSGTYTGSVTNSSSDRTHQQQLTTQSGATYGRNANTSFDDGSATRTITRTNPSGQSSGRTVTVGN
jgi:hypothetical protein